MDHFRVLPADGGTRLLDRDSYDPVTLAAEGHEAPVGDLRPGYLVAADLDWASEEPTVTDLSIERPTLFTFVDDVSPVFEVARDLWEEAVAEGEGMNSCVTRDTDNVVNGAVYVFADTGPTSRFEEFHSGARPLDPLVDRINDRDDDGPRPREVFVLRPAETDDFVIVTIALRKDGLFAETMRDTYDADAPEEPLV
jgi:hypothetical protein